MRTEMPVTLRRGPPGKREAVPHPADEEGRAQPLVRIRGLGKRFPVRRGWPETLLRPRDRQTQEALADVSLDVAPGEMFGLLGRNGAGKSTLFRILATLVLPDAGRAEVAGVDVVADPRGTRRRVVPSIPSERSLYWRLSARENLRLFAALQELEVREGVAKVEQMLDLVGLADTGTKQAGMFSSGMKQRLLIARALLAEPDVLLLDEPTRSLDPVTARDLREFLRDELGRRHHCAIMLATHDADEVRDLCGRVGILDSGRLLLAGNTEGILQTAGRHRHRIVADAPLDPELRAMSDRGLLTVAGPGGRSLGEGWWEIEVDVPGGRAATSHVVGELTRNGVQVASVAPRELSLAELIEVVVANAGRARPARAEAR